MTSVVCIESEAIVWVTVTLRDDCHESTREKRDNWVGKRCVFIVQVISPARK